LYEDVHVEENHQKIADSSEAKPQDLSKTENPEDNKN
jgi:hypothetical protein